MAADEEILECLHSKDGAWWEVHDAKVLYPTNGQAPYLKVLYRVDATTEVVKLEDMPLKLRVAGIQVQDADCRSLNPADKVAVFHKARQAYFDGVIKNVARATHGKGDDDCTCRFTIQWCAIPQHLLESQTASKLPRGTYTSKLADLCRLPGNVAAHPEYAQWHNELAQAVDAWRASKGSHNAGGRVSTRTTPASSHSQQAQSHAMPSGPSPVTRSRSQGGSKLPSPSSAAKGAAQALRHMAAGSGTLSRESLDTDAAALLLVDVGNALQDDANTGPIVPDIPHKELVPLQLPAGLPPTLTTPRSCDLPAMHEQDAHQKAATQPLQAAHKAAGPGCRPAPTMPAKQPQPPSATTQQQQQHASSQQPPMLPTAAPVINTVSAETDPNTSIRQVLPSRPLPPPPLPLIQPWVSDLPQLPAVTTTAHAVAMHGPGLPRNGMVMGTPPLGSLQQQQQQPRQAPQPPSGMPPPPPRPLPPLLPRIDPRLAPTQPQLQAPPSTAAHAADRRPADPSSGKAMLVQGTEADSLAALRVCLPQAFTLGELVQLAGLHARGMITLSHDTRLSVVRAVVGTGVLAVGPGVEQRLLLQRIAALFGIPLSTVLPRNHTPQPRAPPQPPPPPPPVCRLPTQLNGGQQHSPTQQQQQQQQRHVATEHNLGNPRAPATRQLPVLVPVGGLPGASTPVIAHLPDGPIAPTRPHTLLGMADAPTQLVYKAQAHRSAAAHNTPTHVTSRGVEGAALARPVPHSQPSPALGQECHGSGSVTMVATGSQSTGDPSQDLQRQEPPEGLEGFERPNKRQKGEGFQGSGMGSNAI